jgi:hypothetical protein
MKSLRLLAAVCGLTAVGVLAFASTGVAARPASSAPAIVVPINTTDPTGTFAGTFTITQFIVQNGQVAAVGTLAGTVTNAITGAVTTISQDVILPLLAAAPGSCPVLHLELGPLDLNLLGVAVHLDKVVLDITAQSGPGNQVGNLLCTVAHLLDNTNATATAIATLLNNLLGLI